MSSFLFIRTNILRKFKEDNETIRLSIGVEDADDLKQVFNKALK